MNSKEDEKLNNEKLSEQAVKTYLKDLPSEITPERDLWKGIEHAIGHKAQSTPDNRFGGRVTTFTGLSWAASVIVAVLVTWLTLEPAQVKSEINLVSSMQQSFEKQKESLLVSFGTEVDRVLPKEMLEQLRELSSARETINKALTEDPNNSDLINLLHWTQQQELDLIEQLYQPTWQSI